MRIKNKPCWIITYSLNDYYGPTDKYIGHYKFQKTIKEVIKSQMISTNNNVDGLFWKEEMANEKLMDIKRVNPSQFNLQCGDHYWTAKLIAPFEATKCQPT